MKSIARFTLSPSDVMSLQHSVSIGDNSAVSIARQSNWVYTQTYFKVSTNVTVCSGRAGSVVGTVFCIRKVADSDPTLAAT